MICKGTDKVQISSKCAQHINRENSKFMAADIIENKKVASPDLWEIKIDFDRIHVMVCFCNYPHIRPHPIPSQHYNNFACFLEKIYKGNVVQS